MTEKSHKKKESGKIQKHPMDKQDLLDIYKGLSAIAEDDASAEFKALKPLYQDLIIGYLTTGTKVGAVKFAGCNEKTLARLERFEAEESSKFSAAMEIEKRNFANRKIKYLGSISEFITRESVVIYYDAEKFQDKISALTLLGKTNGVFENGSSVTNNITNISEMSESQARELLAKASELKSDDTKKIPDFSTGIHEIGRNAR